MMYILFGGEASVRLAIAVRQSVINYTVDGDCTEIGTNTLGPGTSRYNLNGRGRLFSEAIMILHHHG